MPIPRLALNRKDAATALGMSLDSFERRVQPTIRLVRVGRMRLVPIREVERWLIPGAHDEAAGLLDAFLARAAGASTDPTAAQTAAQSAESQF